ncbi:fatty-acid amide hydrolase 2-A-like isoform X2 [Anthonomus grandis grandis]|uniref:fatty-acid amide hydrolase 2-A-like isoform X2 n=1 Tax=Anthonomus grandis grandis TaxID=2921223 RepID=UPI0021658489|nr:fatty-acid amide hydrolase 2-A-like isoform X2 [Anthonomus grandis grandis]
MEILLTILLVLTRILDFITEPFFKCAAKNKRLYLPPLKNEDILKINATELAKKIRHKKISALEVCKAYIQRIKDVNPILNAIVEDRFREALREAKQVDAYLQKTSLTLEEIEKFKPLLGVPVTVKESCGVKGLSLCCGLLSRKGFTAQTDGEVVAKIKSCGGIILLVSTTPELVISWETWSHVNGYTNNPYNTTCTPGGSSGGEGALLGSAASLVGIGSDIAGSLRLPALFNGVFSHKPTPKVVALKGHWPLGEDPKYQQFLVIGPLTRYACDLRLMMNVMCNDKKCAELKISERVDLKQINIFCIEELHDITQPKVSDSIKKAVNESVKYLTEIKGCKLIKYNFMSFNKAMYICGSELYTLKDIPDALKWENANFWTELVLSIFWKSRFTLNLMYAYVIQKIYQCFVGNYTAKYEEMKQEEKLGDNGVIILPTSIGPAHKHNQMFFKNIYAYLILANALGLPASAVPCGLDTNGMPIGVQVIAAPYQDRLCLAVAEELERHFGGWVPPPKKK